MDPISYAKAVSAENKVKELANKTAVTISHQFADTTARNTYFTANPTELVDNLFVKVGTGYQQYINSAWADSSPIITEAVKAVDQPITDAGGYYTATNTEDALQEIAENTATHLAQTSQQLSSIETANSRDVLEIENYLGNFQNIHPKVLYFENSWNGFSYWMAYTPYPDGSIDAENPCVAVSNDMINWGTPVGVENPLDPFSNDGYNSDTHLVHRQDTDTLEIWWRQYRASDGLRLIYRRTSNDGVNWTPKEIVFSLTEKEEILSPVVIFEDGIYKVWGCRGANVIYRESIGADTSSWTSDITLNIDWASQNLKPWHLDVIHTDLGYEMIMCAYDIATGSNNDADLYYVLQNGDSFTKPIVILARSKNPAARDHKSIYRSSLIKLNGIYYVFYSFVSPNLERGMSLSFGEDIKGLNGFYNALKEVPRPKERVTVLTTPTNLTDYDVSKVDMILINSSAGEVTVNSFVGGYSGKELKIVLNGSNASANFVNGVNLILPNSTSYLATFDKQIVVNLVCTNSAGTTWRVETTAEKSSAVTFASGETLTDYVLGDVETIIIKGSTPITLNSLNASYVGQRVYIITVGSSASCIVVNSNRIILPNSTDYTLNSSQIGMTLICSSLNNGGEWRGFI